MPILQAKIDSFRPLFDGLTSRFKVGTSLFLDRFSFSRIQEVLFGQSQFSMMNPVEDGRNSHVNSLSLDHHFRRKFLIMFDYDSGESFPLAP